jgi:vitamin-K-epoxide reductase (warfarin-sensitive)
MLAWAVVFCASLGLLISLYAYFIKRKRARNKDYRPVCDINERISCTKALESEYGNFFVVSNALVGIFFYGLLLILAWAGSVESIFVLSCLSVLGSVYLAYLSFVKLKVVCPLCVLIYAINVALLIVSSVILF